MAFVRGLQYQHLFVFSYFLTGFADGIGWEQGRTSPQYLETFSWCLRWFFLALSCVSYSIWGMDTLNQVKTLMTIVFSLQRHVHVHIPCPSDQHMQKPQLQHYVSFRSLVSEVWNSHSLWPLTLHVDLFIYDVALLLHIKWKNESVMQAGYQCYTTVYIKSTESRGFYLILFYQTPQLREIYRKSCSSWSRRSPS